MDIQRFPEFLVNFVYTSRLPDYALRHINVLKLQIIILWYSIWILIVDMRQVGAIIPKFGCHQIF